MPKSATTVWKAIYLNGHEYCRVYSIEDRWYLTGTAVFVKDQTPSRLNYLIECDLEWRTIATVVSGQVGEKQIAMKIGVQANHAWTVNGVEEPAVSGCVDIDLNFSPSTNLLPIRRLDLAVGQRSTVNAAWLRFPSFKLEPLQQTYIRLDQNTYRYESSGGAFVAELKVNEFGLVTTYAGIWEEQL